MYTFEKFVDETLRAQTTEELTVTLEAALAEEGYENHIMATISRERFADIKSSRFPKDFLETYLAEDWWLLDPLFPATLRAERPFQWAEVTRNPDLPEKQRAFLEEAKTLGVHSGVVFPFHGPEGRCAVVSISKRHDGGQDPGRIPYLHAICVQAWSRYQELADGVPESARRDPLSNRELEVLQLMKDNFSTDRISERLGIRGKTAEFYIASVMKKLGASTRTGAVVQGIKDRLVTL